VRDGALRETRRNSEGEPWIELLSRKRGTAFVGPSVEAFLEEATAPPQAGLQLDDTHREWSAIGRSLAHAAVLPETEAESRVQAILETLPAELRVSLGLARP
jgi:hypothetical protein